MTTATKSKPKSKPAETLESLREFAESIGLTDASLGKPIDGLLEQALSEDDARQYLELFAPAGGRTVDSEGEQLPPSSDDVTAEDMVDEDELYSFHTHTGMVCEIADTIGVNGKQVWRAFQANEIAGQQRGPDGVDVSGRELLRWIREKNIAHAISDDAIKYVRECWKAQATEAARIEAEAMPKPEPTDVPSRAIAQSEKWAAEERAETDREKQSDFDVYIRMMLAEKPSDEDQAALANAISHLGISPQDVRRDAAIVVESRKLIKIHNERDVKKTECEELLNTFKDFEKESEKKLIDLKQKYRMSRDTMSNAMRAGERLATLKDERPELFADDDDGLPKLRTID